MYQYNVHGLHVQIFSATAAKVIIDHLKTRWRCTIMNAYKFCNKISSRRAKNAQKRFENEFCCVHEASGW